MEETAPNATATLVAGQRHAAPRILALVPRVLVGAALVAASTYVPTLHDSGWQPLGPLLGVALVVFSLFGDLPAWISWTQRLGQWLYPGLLVGTVALLLPFVMPAAGRPTALLAFSPSVWLAYLSIVLVGISFAESSLPETIYRFFQTRRAPPALVMPLFVIIAGLLGNLLDGVSIMAISVVLLLSLLPLTWAMRASFALLFGGLISNLITVAAEPTNIKFQDVLGPFLDRVSPSYWFTNWPISLIGILLPALWLALWMARDHVTWRKREPAHLPDPEADEHIPPQPPAAPWRFEMAATFLLAAGVVAHTALLGALRRGGTLIFEPPLWALVLPAGLIAVWHLTVIGRARETWHRLSEESPVWIKLAVIFSLLWFLADALTSSTNVFAAFFSLPQTDRYSMMLVLSLLSSITDNVALAAMQGSLLLTHPLAIWQVRLLFILLTWSGGFTPFGCLQSLTVNSRLRLSTGAWLRAAWVWGLVAIVGGLVGLVLDFILYPSTIGLPG